jgi:hypothetical protein
MLMFIPRRATVSTLKLMYSFARSIVRIMAMLAGVSPIAQEDMIAKKMPRPKPAIWAAAG